MHTAEIGELDYLRQVVSQLSTAAHGGKGAVIERATGFLQVSRQELYRRLEKVGYKSERKPRSDRGNSKVGIKELRLISGLLMESTRANGKRLMTIKTAVDVARANNWLQADVSQETVGRLLREHKLHPDQLSAPSPHVQLQSLHPNHVWQIDASVCVLYYLGTGGLQVMEEKKFYKNKPQNLKKVEDLRVIRYVLTDHYSGTFYVEYFHGSENSENLTTFFLNGIQRRGADPFHGVPFILSMDAGSANTSHLFLNLLERLQSRPLTHEPGNPRAKGQVEVTNNIIEREFESRLTFHKVQNLNELNEVATRWSLAFQTKEPHTRHGRPRFGMWMTIREDQLRLAPPIELCRELVSTRPVEVTVRGGMTIVHAIKGYGSQEYRVDHVPGLMPRMKVTVVVNPYRAPAVDLLLDDATYTIEPVKKNAAGFWDGAPVIGENFKAQSDTPADRNRKDIRQDAYGVDTEREVEQRRKKHAVPYEGRMDVFADVKEITVPTFMPKRGTAMTVNVPTRELQPLSLVAAAKTLRARGVDWKPSHMTLLSSRYPAGTVPQEDIDALLVELKGGKPSAPISAVGGGRNV